MTEIMRFENGIEKLLIESSKGKTCLIEVFSREAKGISVQGFKQLLSEKSYELTLGETVVYIPKNDVGGKYRDPVDHAIYPERFESVPIIREQFPAYVICDDYLQSGETLSLTVKRLEEQGIDKDKIWAYIHMIFDYPVVGQHDFLDKVDNFKRFLGENSR